MNVRHVSLPIHGRLLYHLIALMTVSIWGVTFVSTKILRIRETMAINGE